MALRVCACVGCAQCTPGGCPQVVSTGYCQPCSSEREVRRGRRQARGYDAAHVRLRKQWQSKVEACEVDCARCGQRIWLDQAWALDHTDDRTGYLGPSHKRCNDSAGGKASHR